MVLLIQLVKIRREIGEISNNPQQFLLESLNSASYSGALGNPLMAPASALDRIDGSVINKFYNVSSAMCLISYILSSSPSNPCPTDVRVSRQQHEFYVFSYFMFQL